MTRLLDLINRLEIVAKKIGMSVEEAVEILEGKHPTHVVVPATFAENLKEPAEAGTARVFVPPTTANAATSVSTAPSTPALTSAPIAETTSSTNAGVATENAAAAASVA